MTKLTKGLIWVCVVLVLVIFILFTKVMILNKNNSDSKYNVSNMHEINISELLELFNNNDTYVVLFGRKDCSVCPQMVTLLSEIQKNNNFITQYIDITSIDFDSDTWNDVVNLLDLETSQYVTENHTGEKETNTFGYFLNTYGFTPTILIIKNGKLIDGFIGVAEEKSFTNWIENKIK